MCFISMDANRLFMALGLPHLMSYGYTNRSISNKHVFHFNGQTNVNGCK